MLAELSDEELMTRIGGGDIFAYAMLVDRHLRSVYRGAYRMLHDKHEAEDVVQESFARIWGNAPRWQTKGAGVAAWLNRVCINLCLDCLRRKTRWASDEIPDLPDPAIPADRMIEQGQVHDILEACLESLSGNQRAAIVLTYYEEYSNNAAAELMNMELKAFESLLYRARRALGQLLSAGGIAASDLELLA